jgi:tetratricopeptide (TPR) repeat protein
MVPPRSARQKRRALAVGVAGSVAVFLAFLPVWFWVDKTIRASREFEEAVPEYLEGGQLRQALAVARLAWQQASLDPEACHLYAKALMRNGKVEEAAAQYGRLFGIECMPNKNYDPLHPRSNSPVLATQRPYFHSEARLEWGSHLHGLGDLTGAVESFELARAFGQDAPERWEPFLYQAYGEYGAWSRAFDSASPGRDELDRLPEEILLALVRWYGCEEEWTRCLDVAETLLARGGSAAQGHFWAGRSLLAAGHVGEAEARLALAVENGHPDAAFFLGRALEGWGRSEEALAAYVGSDSRSPFHGFCLGKAILLLERTTSASDARVKELRNQLRRVFASEASGSLRQHTSEGMDALLVGFTIRKESDESNAPFLLVTHWLRDCAESSPGAEAISVRRRGPNHFALVLGGRCLELKWARNLVPFGSFDSLPAGANSIPGWPMRFGQFVPGSHSDKLSVQTKDGRDCLRVVSDNPSGRSLCFSVPLAAAEEDFYLLAVRCVSDGARLVAGWEWLDESDERVDSHNVVNQRMVDDWSWRGLYRERVPDAAYVRAAVGVYEDEGAALFDDVVIVPLRPPAY